MFYLTINIYIVWSLYKTLWFTWLYTHHTDKLTKSQVELNLNRLIDVPDGADQRVVVLIIKQVLDQFNFVITSQTCKI